MAFSRPLLRTLRREIQRAIYMSFLHASQHNMQAFSLSSFFCIRTYIGINVYIKLYMNHYCISPENLYSWKSIAWQQNNMYYKRVIAMLLKNRTKWLWHLILLIQIPHFCSHCGWFLLLSALKTSPMPNSCSFQSKTHPSVIINIDSQLDGI